MGVIMDGEAQPSQIAALLVGLTLKGERPTEVVGFATAMRQRATPLPAPVGPVFDTCGTGGDGAHTFNVSTAAALIVAGCGRAGRQARQPRGVEQVRQRGRLRGARHRPRRPAGPRDSIARSGEAGVLLCAGVASVDAARGAHSPRAGRAHGVQPARPAHEPGEAGAAARLACRVRSTPNCSHVRSGSSGSERAWVVYGAGGLDEISTLGHTKVSELHRGTVNTFYVHPADAGLPVASVGDLRGGTAAENAAMIEDVVGGGAGAAPRHRAAQRRRLAAHRRRRFVASGRRRRGPRRAIADGARQARARAAREVSPQ